MKQTAVEFLEKEIIEIMSYLEEDGAYAMQGVKDKLFGEKNIIQQAKEMEKEQSYTYDELRTIAYNAYCLGQLNEPTEGKYNLWIQQFKKK